MYTSFNQTFKYAVWGKEAAVPFALVSSEAAAYMIIDTLNRELPSSIRSTDYYKVTTIPKSITVTVKEKTIFDMEVKTN